MNAEHVFLLRDYTHLNRYWRVDVAGGQVLRLCQAEKGANETVHGMVERWILAGEETTMAFLSTARLENLPGAPDYSKNLLIIVNERLLGAGCMAPQLYFRRGYFVRDVLVRAQDGWTFRAHYSAPWLREIVRKSNLGGTLEYDPVDFVQRLAEVVSCHRPEWILNCE